MDPETHTLLVSRDVVFDETTFDSRLPTQSPSSSNKIFSPTDDEFESPSADEGFQDDLGIVENFKHSIGIETCSHTSKEVQSLLCDSHLSSLLDLSTRILTRSHTRNEVNLALMSSIEESTKLDTISKALSQPHWKHAMNVEYESLMKSHTWDLVDLPPEKEPIGYKWVFKTKYKADGSINKYKVCLVAKGYAQQEGIDFEETFAPTTKLKTI